MRVIEVAPGGGYWSEILAPYAKATAGTYIAAQGRPGQRLPDRFSNSAVYGNINYTVFSNDSGPMGPANSADLVVALGRNHERILRDMGVPPARLRMLRSFDPKSGAHALDVEDPYYGTHDDFEDTFAVIEVCLPGLHAWVDEQLAGRGIAS